MNIEKMIDFLKNNEIDAALVASVHNNRYISGFTGDTSYLYISKNRCVLLTDSRYTTWAKSEVHDFEIFEVNAKCTYSDVIKEFLLNDGVKRIGFEDKHMLYCDVKKFQEKCDFVEFVPMEEKLDELRQIKTQDEINKIRTAEKIGDDAFEHIVKFIDLGQSEEEIALELEMFMRKNGAAKLSFETIVASGANSAMPHATPGKRKIQKGDFVILDFGCLYEGYCSDMTRTLIIGEPDEKMLKIYDTVLNAQNAALTSICAEKKCCDIDKIARDYIAKAGYGENFGHGLGHSVGLYIHEEPRLSPSCDKILKENMLMTVEPGIYIEGLYGVRIEDLVVVRKDGIENLTGSPKEKIIIK